LTFAIDQGLIPAPPPLDLKDPGSLQARSRLAGVAEAHYGVPVSPLSDSEATRLRVEMENMTADAKVGVLRSLREGLDDRHIKTVAAQFAKRDPNVLALAMGLSVDAPEAASRILRGQDILRDNPKINPTGTELAATRDRINEVLGEAYLHNPEEFAAVSEAALAVYALNSWQARDLSGVLDTSRLDGALRVVTGGTLTIGRSFFFGGGYKIQAPAYGATEEDFLRLIEGADFSGARGLNADEIRRNATFESVGDGRYLVRVGPGYVQGERGPFILDLSQAQTRDLPPRLTIEVSR